MDYNNYPSQTRQITPLEQQYHEKDKVKRELNHAIGQSAEVLGRATTVFPFTLFPDTVTIDRSKLTITHRSFFSVAEVTSIRIEDMLNVIANVGPFFGSLKVSTRFFDSEKEPLKVNWLWREDALRLKRVIQGYIIAIQEHIDCSALSAAELALLLDRLSGTVEDRS